MHTRSGKHRNTLAVVCHDTGGANALAAYVSSANLSPFRLRTVCIGKACEAFRSAGVVPDQEFDRDPGFEAIDSLVEEMGSDAVLLGTSFDSWTERRFCKKMREQGLFTLSFVDWWSNFGGRFSTPGSNDLAFLPETIAVMDEDARNGCIADSIPSHLLQVTGNPYWDYLADHASSIVARSRERIRNALGISGYTLLGLIISSNIRNLHLGLGYDETDFFLSVRPLPEHTEQGTPIAWVVKPHPKESPAELREMLTRERMPLPLFEGISAIEAVAASDFVLGMCSSVLFEAALLGKTVVSLQPRLNKDRLHYLRIFDHLGIPKIIQVDEAKAVVQNLVNGRISASVLSKVPFPLGNNRATDRITALLQEGMRTRHRMKDISVNR